MSVSVTIDASQRKEFGAELIEYGGSKQSSNPQQKLFITYFLHLTASPYLDNWEN